MLARLQGLYYFATGIWPLLSMRSFEAVTGPKADRWLVKTVGVLVAVIGASLLQGERRPSPSLATLGAASAAGLGAVETIYTARRRISRVYLLDAVLELCIVAAWVLALAQRGKVGRPKRSVFGGLRRSRSS